MGHARRIGMALVLGLAPAAASAEWNAAFYASVTQTRDIEAGALGTLEGRTTEGFGSRVGYWFDSAPWLGLAGDFSAFDVAKDMGVGSISLLLTARLPRSTASASPGLEPYVGLGVARYQSYLKAGPVEEESYDTAPDYRAGVTWWFRKRWGLLAEYRYTEVKASFPSLPGELTFKTHHGNLGLVYRWGL